MLLNQLSVFVSFTFVKRFLTCTICLNICLLQSCQTFVNITISLNNSKSYNKFEYFNFYNKFEICNFYSYYDHLSFLQLVQQISKFYKKETFVTSSMQDVVLICAAISIS